MMIQDNLTVEQIKSFQNSKENLKQNFVRRNGNER